MTDWPIPLRLSQIFDGGRRAEMVADQLWAHLMSEHSTHMNARHTTIQEMYDEHARLHSLMSARDHSPDSIDFDPGLIALQVADMATHANPKEQQ